MNALIAALVFGIVNALIGPILRLISLPLTIITLGLFTFVINYLLFVITVHFVNMYNPGSGINPWIADLYGAHDHDGRLDDHAPGRERRRRRQARAKPPTCRAVLY